MSAARTEAVYCAPRRSTLTSCAAISDEKARGTCSFSPRLSQAPQISASGASSASLRARPAL